MTYNTIRTPDSVEVYEHDINILCDQYISDLENPDMVYNNNKSCFNGMLKHIARNYFVYNPLDYKDIHHIDSMFGIYTSLCYRYLKKPTILGFCVMCNISPDVYTSWSNGEYNGEKLNQEFTDFAKRSRAECQSAVYDGAIEQNSVGCIFALKSVYGYTETAPAPAAVRVDRKTPAEIAVRHGVAVEAAAAPALPAAGFVQFDGVGNATNAAGNGKTLDIVDASN